MVFRIGIRTKGYGFDNTWTAKIPLLSSNEGHCIVIKYLVYHH